jgi:dihydroorotate dehydrogenase (NAD+) catalytic subunit
MPNRLATEIAGLQLTNPTILAAGILGLSTATLKEAINQGAGAVVTKSVSLKPRQGYANPAIVQIDNYGLLNAMGLPNPGAKYFANEIKQLKRQPLHAPIIASVFGYTPNEYAQTAQILTKAGADAIELNVSCPHVEKTGSEIGQNPNLVTKVVKQVKNTTKKPIIAKLTPNVTDITEIAKAAVNAGADAIAATNTARGMAIDVETAHPILANKVGGLSGSALKPIAVRCVYEIYRAVKVPIVGCGGIATWHDAVEFMLAGASAVQVGTAIASQGFGVFRSLSDGIDRYVRDKGFRSVREIVGLSHRRW